MKRIFSLILIMVLTLSGCSVERIDDKPLAESIPLDTRTDIVIASGNDIVTLDPHEASDTYSIEVINMIYEQLVSVDKEGNYCSELAEIWEIADDTQYVFHLRKGVRFHNGKEMTAEDVVFSLNRAMEHIVSRAALENVCAIEALDEYTVKITTCTPYSALMRNLATSYTSILCKSAVENDQLTEIVGTGPMILTEYKPNYHTILTRNNDYRGEEAKISTFTRRVIPDDAARTIALENGEIDYLYDLSSADIARVKANPNLKTVENVSSNIAYMGFNTARAPFDDVRVRQALHYATDKQEIIESVYEGYGTACKSIFPTTMEGYNDDINLYNFDIERARKTLTASGYPDGFDMEIVLSSDNRSRMAQILQDDYRKIGVNISIRQMEFSAMLQYLEQDKHDAFIMSWSEGHNHDLTVTTNFHSEGGNRMHYSNPTVDQLIERARGTLDWEMCKPLYKELQKLVMIDSPWIPIIQQVYVSGMNKDLRFDESVENPRGYIDLVICSD